MHYVDDDPIHAIKSTSDVHLMHRIFNASNLSRRVFSEVHYYHADPDLTIGMGHWIRSNISKLFSEFRSNHEAWRFLINRWSTEMTVQHWQQIQTETGEQGKTPSSLERALMRVLCIDSPIPSCVENTLEPWADSVGTKFNDKGHWFAAGWKSVSRAEPLAKVQTKYWRDSVLLRGAEAAKARDLSTRGGVACVISAKSSGLGATMFRPSDKSASASGDGVSRRWSLTTVPDDAKPEPAFGLNTEMILQDWRSLVAWQFYTIKKRRVRSRMIAIWEEFFSQTWGKLENPGSVSDSTRARKHTGVLMDRTAFNFSVMFS
ncbi:hypothetical protein [Leisingera sp. ANG-M7]|uniref:hypothetical protein n=1 Tax=Leisingera sp. ANG-M7 TaxID=1577902 RepID=UPI00126A7A26|nr:hypothetical protein [Leisingera sp. ANG-M7]